MANKAILSADAFLAGIAGETVQHTIPGVGAVKIRSLTAAEVNRLNDRHAGNNIAMMIDGVALGLVDPALDEDQVARLNDAKPGHLVSLWQRISLLSGLGDGEMLAGEAGGGS